MLPLLIGAGAIVLGATIVKKVITKTVENRTKIKEDLIEDFCNSDRFEAFKEKHKDQLEPKYPSTQEISELMKKEILIEAMELDFESKYPSWSRGFLSDTNDKAPLIVDSMDDYIESMKEDVLNIKISTELEDVITLNGIGKTDLEPYIEMRIKIKLK